jgi:hypothetical protein
MRRRNGKSGANRTKLILSRMVPNRQTYYLSLSGCSGGRDFPPIQPGRKLLPQYTEPLAHAAAPDVHHHHSFRSKVFPHDVGVVRTVRTPHF